MMVEPDVPGITQATDPPAAATANGAGASPPWESEHDPFRSSPELFVGAAFLGGLVLARMLRRIGRD